MRLKERITEDMKTAMRAKDAPRLLTIRGLLAAMKQREVDERIVLDDAAVVAIVDKLSSSARTRSRSSAPAAPGPGRQGDRRARRSSKAICRSASAPPRSPAKSRPIVAETGATGPADMGKVMAAAKARFAGRADMGRLRRRQGRARTLRSA